MISGRITGLVKTIVAGSGGPPSRVSRSRTNETGLEEGHHRSHDRRPWKKVVVRVSCRHVGLPSGLRAIRGQRLRRQFLQKFKQRRVEDFGPF